MTPPPPPAPHRGSRDGPSHAHRRAVQRRAYLTGSRISAGRASPSRRQPAAYARMTVRVTPLPSAPVTVARREENAASAGFASEAAPPESVRLTGTALQLAPSPADISGRTSFTSAFTTPGLRSTHTGSPGGAARFDVAVQRGGAPVEQRREAFGRAQRDFDDRGVVAGRRRSRPSGRGGPVDARERTVRHDGLPLCDGSHDRLHPQGAGGFPGISVRAGRTKTYG